MPAANPDCLPIAEHGVIGDQRSIALVGTDGTIDWYCPDRFDGPSVFAAISTGTVAAATGSRPGIRIVYQAMYLPECNVLITRFLSPERVSEVQDFMPLGTDRQRLIRRVVGVRGCVTFRLELDPRFDYGLVQPTIERGDEWLLFQGSGQLLAFAAGASVTLEPTSAGVVAEFEIRAGDSCTFALESGPTSTRLDAAAAEGLIRDTALGWRAWLGQSTWLDCSASSTPSSSVLWSSMSPSPS
jgi:GH15 family glucan-1,4-alpha-glucosidase